MILTLLLVVTIPDEVVAIGNSAFAECKGLTSVIIPDDVTTIDAYAFYHCDSLTSVTIGDRVTSISNCAFEDCTSSTNITIPDSVTSMGDSAFSCCSKLQTITIPESVTAIGDYAFSRCLDLKKITFLGNPDLGINVFGDCSDDMVVRCNPHCIEEFKNKNPLCISVKPTNSFMEQFLKNNNVDLYTSLDDCDCTL